MKLIPPTHRRHRATVGQARNLQLRGNMYLENLLKWVDIMGLYHTYCAPSFLGREIYHHESYPAPDHPYCRVRTDEHERQELVAFPKHQAMNCRAVRNQRNANCDV